MRGLTSDELTQVYGAGRWGGGCYNPCGGGKGSKGHGSKGHGSKPHASKPHASKPHGSKSHGSGSRCW